MERKNIVRATPAARFFAKENDIDLADVKGSGAKGRVHKCDVIDYKNNTKVKISPLANRIAEIEGIDIVGLQGSGPRGRIMKADILSLMNKDIVFDATILSTPNKEESIINNDSGDIEVIPMSSMRKVIAKRMSESYFTAPTFIVNVDVDMTELLELRKKTVDLIMEETGKKATVTDFISLAVIKSLMKHPYVNASLSADQKEIYLHKYVNLGIAVGSDTGLLVPVIKRADKMTLTDFVVDSKSKIAAALEGKLKPEEMSDSTFTISNLGMYGVSSFIPIINQPNNAILGISSTIKKPVVVDDEIVIRPMMTLTLTIDHRVVDGLEGAKFMQTLKKAIENPIALFI